MKLDGAAKDYANAVAGTIKRHRIAMELSMNKLAEDSGLSQPMIGLIERGIHAPTVATLYRITKTLGTTPAALLAEVEVTPASPESVTPVKIPGPKNTRPIRKKVATKPAKPAPAKKRPKPL